jgi:REP element-mobilizing transposase RayT
MRIRNAPLSNPSVYLITCVSHNSRESERMRKYNVRRGPPVIFSEKDEIFITKSFAGLVKKNDLKILAYNICKDHIHFVIVCASDKLNSIVQNMKSVTSRKFNSRRKVPELWAQKFSRKIIEDDEGLENVLDYVQNNRMKHNLEENKMLQRIIEGMLTPIESLYD